ncbi:MAG: hypothetical protein HYR49_05175 [Gammaproteobacteria bacterium]|nr:hypothetical protein [Gammaproteobacteria bacterium]
MKTFIVSVISAAIVTLSGVAQARIHNEPGHFTREYAREAQQAMSRWVELELRNFLKAGAPALRIEETGKFGLDHPSLHAETQASNSGPASSK